MLRRSRILKFQKNNLLIGTLLCLSLISACGGFQSNKSICDSQILSSKEWKSRLDAPENYNSEEINGIIDIDPTMEVYVGTFENAELVWYVNERKQSLACIVFEGSDRPNAILKLSEDKSITKPIELRVLGIPFK
jgi:hypothetical protein